MRATADRGLGVSGTAGGVGRSGTASTAGSVGLPPAAGRLGVTRCRRRSSSGASAAGGALATRSGALAGGALAAGPEGSPSCGAVAGARSGARRPVPAWIAVAVGLRLRGFPSLGGSPSCRGRRVGSVGTVGRWSDLRRARRTTGSRPRRRRPSSRHRPGSSSAIPDTVPVRGRQPQVTGGERSCRQAVRTRAVVGHHGRARRRRRTARRWTVTVTAPSASE